MNFFIKAVILIAVTVAMGFLCFALVQPAEESCHGASGRFR